ncbi:glycosyltransferase family 2 protein [Patescibacteria group bacterium]|nr:glycosyltransferase family 2 protein [Patescibacteria group bacterium]MBU1931218.1 glycosyltransferase family 2 protein [Patescibacteria group bacterium]
MKISIIIPNYNGVAVLAKNLPQVIKQAESAEIIVVDDASTDKSVSLIKNKFPQIKLVVKKTNTGFAASCNLGVKKSKGEIIILLNHDACPKKDWLKPLLSHFKDSQVFAVGCLEEDDGIERGRGVASFKRGWLVHSRGEVDQTNTLWVSGGSGAFRKSLWQKLGGFDLLYAPFYWEDIDLSYRALKAGYQLVFESQSRVVHHHIRGAIRQHHSPTYIKTIAYSNQFLFFWKNITDPRLIAAHFLWMPYHFISAALRRDWPFFKGFFLALLKLPAVFRQKQKATQFSQLKDHQVIAPFKNEI